MNPEPLRPDPDRLLERVNTSSPGGRGKLKIFLGYAAGVGKTYAMLEAARMRLAEGVDVVAGYVETHGRAETEALLTGLEIMPLRYETYRGITLPEFDLDAVLKRKPQLALVDEFAHTNVPGSRHPKRYLDVEELLDAGIDVYTTLNIQHLESVRDAVSQITGIVVRETVPDRAFDLADDIEVIDLPPEELQRRLADGKVYVPEQAAQAVKKFFRGGNLAALREMTMRRAADRIDDQMRLYMQRQEIPGPWPASERVLVAISPSPLSQRLIRSGKRLADELGVKWYAAYVETPSLEQSPPVVRNRLAANLKLAKDLGAEVAALKGQSIVAPILEFARQENVTKIIVGKPLKPRIADLIQGSVVDQLARSSGPIDIYVISGDRSLPIAPAPPLKTSGSAMRGYLYSILLVAAATLLSWPVHQFIDPANLVMVYLASVVFAAMYLGRGPAIVNSLAGVLAFDYFWVYPYFTFAVRDTEYLLTFVGLFGVGLVISTLTSRLRQQLLVTSLRENRIEVLFSLSRALNALVDRDAIARTLTQAVNQSFGCSAVILLRDAPDSPLEPRPALEHQLESSDIAVAEWAFSQRKAAGYGTTTLPASRIRCIPLVANENLLGILGVWLAEVETALLPEQEQLLDAIASLAGLTLERSYLAREAGRLRMFRARDELQMALLNSVSHEVRTPLTAVKGVLSSLAQARSGGARAIDAATESELIETAQEQADRLDRVFGNLLNMQRIDAGAVTVKKEPEDLRDLIGTALHEAKDRIGKRKVNVDIPDNIPLLPVDYGLFVQALANLIDNAAKYSDEDAPIDITARVVGRSMQLSVADRGPGIPENDLKRVFEKFYRVKDASRPGGVGLGLAIAKGFTEAQGGTIGIEPREGGGLLARLTLPVDELGRSS